MGRMTIQAGAIGALMLLSAACAWGDDAADTAGQAGRMRVYVDPETGELTAPPPQAEVSQPPAYLQGQVADDDLVEEVNPAGGYSIDLQRRFGGVVRAEAAPQPGAPVVECEAGAEPVAK